MKSTMSFYGVLVRQVRGFLVVCAALCLVLVSVAGCSVTFLGDTSQTSGPAPFPSISGTALNADQRALLTVLEAEYAKQPPGTTYSQGVDEPWCADFVSWVYNSVGLPFDNPNSGSWRIPGVFTLEDYFRSAHMFHSPDAGFTPQLGDVVLYDSTTSKVWGGHTNIVLSVDSGQLTTIGGNQPGGITITTYALTDPELGIRGYGRRIP